MTVRFDYHFDPGPGLEAAPTLAPGQPLMAVLRAVAAAGSLNLAARQLGMSYRHLWGYLQAQEAAFGTALVERRQGQAARLSPCAERLLAAEALALARSQPALEVLAGQMDNQLQAALHPEWPRLSLAASHDLLFAQLRRLAQQQSLLLDIEFLGSAPALERLNSGEAQVAGIHLPLEIPTLCQRDTSIHRRVGRYLKLGEHKLIRMSHREQGLMVARGNPLGIQGLADLTRPALRFINRQPGAATRLILDDLLTLQRIPRSAIHGYRHEEQTHLAVAAAVASGAGDCGLGLRASAVQLGLDFIPLLRDQYFLVCTRDTLDTPPLLQLRSLLESPAYHALVAAQAGYSAEGAGQVISLRQTLPWYKS